jgi:hypothetical protein
VEWSVSEDEVFCALGWGVRVAWWPCRQMYARYALYSLEASGAAKDVSHWLKLGGVFFLRGGRCVTLKVLVTTSPKSPLASDWWSTASNARRKSTDAREPYARTCFIGGDASA